MQSVGAYRRQGQRRIIHNANARGDTLSLNSMGDRQSQQQSDKDTICFSHSALILRLGFISRNRRISFYSVGPGAFSVSVSG